MFSCIDAFTFKRIIISYHVEISNHSINTLTLDGLFKEGNWKQLKVKTETELKNA